MSLKPEAYFKEEMPSMHAILKERLSDFHFQNLMLDMDIYANRKQMETINNIERLITKDQL